MKNWDYLKLVDNEITQDDDIEVGLLIGANCMKAQEPQHIISGQHGGLYAYQGRLGRCIMQNPNKGQSVSRNHVVVKYAVLAIRLQIIIMVFEKQRKILVLKKYSTEYICMILMNQESLNPTLSWTT